MELEDGSGKCLLDVISDPSALTEFLQSNSQILLDGDPSPSKAQSFQGTNVMSSNQSITSAAQTFTSQITLPTGSTIQHVTHSRPPVSFVNSSMSQTMVRNMNGSASNITTSPRQVTIGKSNSPISNLANVTKGITISPAISPVSYQGKKPIPIQPKNPVILPNTSIQSGVNVRGNVRHGLGSQTPTSLMSNQIQMAQSGVLARGHAPSSINGVDTSKSRVTPIQSSRTAQPAILATPPKRIAPKQVLSSTTSPSLAMPSPVRLQQTNIQNKQNIQLIQAPTVQGSPGNANKLFPQQMATVVRPIGSNNQGTTIVQSANTAQPVQQIQQLINDKLSVQQTQPSNTGQVQQKVFTQAQLQTALKQSQLIAQNSPGQPQNILVQQQILKQLIQQAQQVQQQKPTDKTTSLKIQPIVTNAQRVVPLQQPQQVKQTVQAAVPQQVTVANQIPGNNQIQMVLPNQQVVTLTQNAVSSNQQTINMARNVAHVTTANLTQNVTNKTQPMIIVSQAGGNFVFQQSNGGTTTTAGTSVNIPLQNLLNQQQKHIQSQLTTSSIHQQQPIQQQVKIGNTIFQVQQPKQISQPTVVVQNQVVQGQTVTPVKQGVTQQNVVIQTKPGVVTTQAGTTIQQLTPAQLQQLQNMGGVQKVLIIKQPDVLQKLANVQGGKPPQAIQITTQQLQALQQMQSQQTSTAQKIIIQSRTDGNSQSTTVLTAQQLKQLQQSLQQSGKIVQIPQTQKQTLVQQLQQQNTKTPSKMAHVPRILQTSGRQVSSQVSAKTPTIKQEPNRGVKRPHTEPEPPKVVRRLKNALYQDQQTVTHPDFHTPFKSKLDAFNKLRCYHVYHDPGQTPSDVQKSDMLFNTVSTQLIKKSEKMMEKYRSLILDESIRKEPSSEMVMLYRLFLADERAALAKSKQQLAEELKTLRAIPKAPLPASTTITSTTANIVEKPPEMPPPPVIPKPQTPPPAIATATSTLEEMETTELDVLTADSLLDTHENSPLLDDGDDDEGSDVELEENEIDKAVFNMESSASYYKPVNHLSDSLIDSPRTSTGHNDGDESAEELMIEDDAEKEDVTATLALLHSMAEELDGNIS